jgi:hypothetical protein
VSTSRSNRSLSVPELAASKIKEFLDHPVNKGSGAFELSMLASACMVEAAWSFDHEVGPEQLFEECKARARRDLKRRAERLQAKLLAGEAPNPVAN